MLTVLNSSATVNEINGTLAGTGNNRRPARTMSASVNRREHQFDQHVRSQDRCGRSGVALRRLQNPAFTVDGDDRDQRQHGARCDQSEVRIGKSTDMTRGASGGTRPARIAEQPAQDQKDHDGDADRAEHTQRLADEDLEFEPGRV